MNQQHSAKQAPRTKIRNNIRDTIRQKRKQISYYQKKSNARQLANKVLQLDEIQSSKNIAVYLSNDGEIDLQMLIEELWQSNKNCYLPVLDKKNKGSLLFLTYIKHQPLVKNCFNILEPVYQQKHSKTALQMDVILMPLVAFDKDCNRIGMGGGYYDRSLSFTAKEVKPVLIGVAHSIQQVKKIPTEKWDIGLNKVVTEKQIFTSERDILL